MTFQKAVNCTFDDVVVYIDCLSDLQIAKHKLAYFKQELKFPGENALTGLNVAHKMPLLYTSTESISR